MYVWFVSSQKVEAYAKWLVAFYEREDAKALRSLLGGSPSKESPQQVILVAG